jgi:hypothetical protein
MRKKNSAHGIALKPSRLKLESEQYPKPGLISAGGSKMDGFAKMQV